MSAVQSTRAIFQCRIGVSLGLFALLSTAAPAAGQEGQTGLRLGGVRLTSSASTAMEFDSNVNNDHDPKGDWTIASLLDVEARARVGIAAIRAKSVLDATYYNIYRQRRSVGVRQELEGEFYLARLRPFLAQSLGNVRTPFSVEIDLPVRRVELGTTIGADLRITALTTLRGQVDRRETDFANDAVYRGQGLRAPLNSVSKKAQVSLLHELTPLTRLLLTGEILRDQFKLQPWRDAKSFQVASGVMFQPHALISGSATIGYRRFALVDSQAPPFVGLVGSADLSYTLLGATRFNVRVSRDVPYSLSSDQPYFVSLMLGMSVTHAFRDNWEVQGEWLGDRMAYRSLSSIVGARTDHVRGYRVAVQRRFNRRLRVGVNFQTNAHQSPNPRSEYRKSMMGTSIVYGF
jgi:hypothetical protein